MRENRVPSDSEGRVSPLLKGLSLCYVRWSELGVCKVGLMDLEADVRGGWSSWAPRATERLWGSDFHTLCFHPINIPNGSVGGCRAPSVRELSDLEKPSLGLGFKESSLGRWVRFHVWRRKERIS